MHVPPQASTDRSPISSKQNPLSFKLSEESMLVLKAPIASFKLPSSSPATGASIDMASSNDPTPSEFSYARVFLARSCFCATILVILSQDNIFLKETFFSFRVGHNSHSFKLKLESEGSCDECELRSKNNYGLIGEWGALGLGFQC